MSAVLDSLAAELVTTFPGADDAPLARALLRLLARGGPVTDVGLAGATGRSHDELTSALARWPNVHRGAGGAIVAFGGLSTAPTAHSLVIDGRPLFAWCAWDTLFLPALLGAPARVQSRCPVSGADVRLVVQPDRIQETEPHDLWVSFPPAERADTTDIVGSFCCHVHFLAGRPTAQRWHAEHAGAREVTLADAYELGRRATHRLRAGALTM